MDTNSQPPPSAIEPKAEQTTTAEQPRPLNSWQLKQHSEAVIACLMQTGLFSSKQHLLQAALMSLFADMQRAFKAAEAKQQAAPKPELTIPDVDPHAVAEQRAGEPNTDLQD